jgi:hypothetical protein
MVVQYGASISGGSRGRWSNGYGANYFARQSVWCVPSQKGGFFVCLHWHNATSFVSVSVNSSGSMPVPSWEPSQKG